MEADYGIELTPRQKEIWRLIASGHTSKDISEKLGIKKRTAEVHTQSIYKRLHIHNRIEAITERLRLGLDPTDESVNLNTPPEYIIDTQHPLAAALTEKQTLYLKLISQGLSNQRIAKETKVSESAVSKNLTRLYRALGVKSDFEAVHQALSKSILIPTPSK